MQAELTKETFENMINQMINIDKTLDALSDIGFIGDDNILYEVYDLLVNTLSDLVKNKIGDDELISWWVFECDFGKSDLAVIYFDDGDTEVVLDSVDKLWEYILSEAIQDA